MNSLVIVYSHHQRARSKNINDDDDDDTNKYLNEDTFENTTDTIEAMSQVTDRLLEEEENGKLNFDNDGNKCRDEIASERLMEMFDMDPRINKRQRKRTTTSRQTTESTKAKAKEAKRQKVNTATDNKFDINNVVNMVRNYIWG
jgi:hypothetical protein